MKKLINQYIPRPSAQELLQKVFSNQSAIDTICFIYNKDIDDFITEVSKLICLCPWDRTITTQEMYDLYKSETKGSISGNKEDDSKYGSDDAIL